MWIELPKGIKKFLLTTAKCRILPICECVWIHRENDDTLHYTVNDLEVVVDVRTYPTELSGGLDVLIPAQNLRDAKSLHIFKDTYRIDEVVYPIVYKSEDFPIIPEPEQERTWVANLYSDFVADLKNYALLCTAKTEGNNPVLEHVMIQRQGFWTGGFTSDGRRLCHVVSGLGLNMLEDYQAVIPHDIVKNMPILDYTLYDAKKITVEKVLDYDEHGRRVEKEVEFVEHFFMLRHIADTYTMQIYWHMDQKFPDVSQILPEKPNGCVTNGEKGCMGRFHVDEILPIIQKASTMVTVKGRTRSEDLTRIKLSFLPLNNHSTFYLESHDGAEYKGSLPEIYNLSGHEIEILVDPKFLLDIFKPHAKGGILDFWIGDGVSPIRLSSNKANYMLMPICHP